ncbi:uncharacterized protein LOC117193044 [Drosophila miranda]|uniref:uncharacterized protein LOC117193044 n=1 Tax=Drosophila miranda TaxID=7229 RepID=UPI00143F621A|nr:uncharacterized protein LOC117193044 [Drosophila miranda]
MLCKTIKIWLLLGLLHSTVGKKNWDFETVSLVTYSTDDSQMKIESKVERLKRGEFGLSCTLEWKYDIDETTMVESSAKALLVRRRTIRSCRGLYRSKPSMSISTSTTWTWPSRTLATALICRSSRASSSRRGQRTPTTSTSASSMAMGFRKFLHPLSTRLSSQSPGQISLNGVSL